MPTPLQVYNALSIENTYNILNVSSPHNTQQFVDITDYAALGLTSGAGDTVKVLSQILDPVNQGVYENSGYAAGDYASPDCTLISHTAPLSNLNTYTGTSIPIYGAYVFNLKVQVTVFGEAPFVVEKTFYVELNEGLIPSLSLQETPNCANATYKSVDTTSYGAPSGYSLLTIVRTHTVRPPLVSKESDNETPQTSVTANAQTIQLGSPDNPLWTGTYEASLSVVLTYKYGNNYTIINVPEIGVDQPVDCDNNFCRLICCLNDLIGKYNEFKGVNTVQANMYFQKWQKGTMWFFAILNQCNNPTLVTAYTTQFYLDTGCDPNCDCDCTDTPAPVIPTDIINGTDGADGLTAEFRVSGTLFQWKYTNAGSWNTLFDFASIAGTDGTSFLQGSGVPSSGLGNNGDSYLNLTNGDVYLKTAGSWSVTGNLHGADGVALLFSDPADYPTTGTSPQTLNTAPIPALTFTQAGDMVRFRIILRRSNASGTFGVAVTVAQGANNTQFGNGSFPSTVNKLIFDGTIVRSGAAQVQVEGMYTYYGVSGFAQQIAVPKVAVVYDFTASNAAISVVGTSTVSGNLTEELMNLTLYRL